MGSVYGSTIPAAIWKAAMKVATQKFGASDFDYPSIELKRYATGAAKLSEMTKLLTNQKLTLRQKERLL